jgi:hypothetical protein
MQVIIIDKKTQKAFKKLCLKATKTAKKFLKKVAKTLDN